MQFGRCGYRGFFFFSHLIKYDVKTILTGAIVLAYTGLMLIKIGNINKEEKLFSQEVTITITSLKEKEIEQNAAEKVISYYSKLGIKYPRVVLAQNIQETGYFSSRVCNENKNILGMKRNNRGLSINPPGAKRPRDCPCFDWDLHACYTKYEDGLKDYTYWQQLVLEGYKSKFGKYPASDTEYIDMLGHLYFPGSKSPKRYASDPKYTKHVHEIWKTKVLPLVPNPQ